MPGRTGTFPAPPPQSNCPTTSNTSPPPPGRHCLLPLPTASSGLVDYSCATCRGTRRWSSPVRQGEESMDTSADVSERGAGFCGWRITATMWSQLDEVCILFLELAFRDVRMQGSFVCSPEQARQTLEAVEHHVSVASNPSYGLEEILQLVWLTQDGKMKGEGIAVVGREQRRSGRSWRWVEVHCCPSSAKSTPRKVVSKTMR